MLTQTKLIINSEINGPDISAKGKKYIQNDIFEHPCIYVVSIKIQPEYIVNKNTRIN